MLRTRSSASASVGQCQIWPVVKFGLTRASPFPQDLSHATIEMHTSVGRTRSARLVGKDLAEFYM